MSRVNPARPPRERTWEGLGVTLRLRPCHSALQKPLPPQTPPKRQTTPLAMTPSARRHPQVSTAPWALCLARGVRALLQMAPTPDSPAHPMCQACPAHTPAPSPSDPAVSPLPPAHSRQCPTPHSVPICAQVSTCGTAAHRPDPCHVPEVPVPHRAQYSEWELRGCLFPPEPLPGAVTCSEPCLS